MANLIKDTHIFDPVITPSLLHKFDKIYLMDFLYPEALAFK